MLEFWLRQVALIGLLSTLAGCDHGRSDPVHKSCGAPFATVLIHRRRELGGRAHRSIWQPDLVPGSALQMPFIAAVDTVSLMESNNIGVFVIGLLRLIPTRTSKVFLKPSAGA